MPKLSIVIPAHNVQPYIRKCLDSVLSQSFQDIEVIAVNGTSPDASGPRDEYAYRDPRVRVIRPSETVGLSKAKNTGANKATGEYLLFLDRDDAYLPGSLEAIAEQLEKTDNPDLLVFDHVRTHWDRKASNGTSSNLLASSGDSTFTLMERPEMAHLPAMASNRAFRTKFWWQNELAFLPGLYQESALAYKALITAESITCLDLPCLDHHRFRADPTTVLPSRQHFDIFAQYASVFAYIEQRPELDSLREIVFHRMINHFLDCLEQSSRVRPGDRRVYFRRIRDLYRNHCPREIRYPKNWLGFEFCLIELGFYTPFKALKKVEHINQKSKPIKQDIQQATKILLRYLRYGQLNRPTPHSDFLHSPRVLPWENTPEGNQRP